MTPIVAFNQAVAILLFVFFCYQGLYTWVGYKKGTVRLPPAKRRHRYAVVIAAHNEEPVIANLIQSLNEQEWPDGLLDIYVVADACTDATAEVARRAGAIVYERNDLARKGKSWVLDYAFNRILDECPGRYEGYFVFDADNVVAPDFVEQMNRAFDMGYLVVTSYRNSKNFDSSWVSSAYALSFLREARYLNNPRMIMGTGCMISGSGWLVSAKIIEPMHGWDFHTLSEDYQFSAFCCSNGIRIGYAPAELFDEQPVHFSESWTQRLRWSKGFYQVLFSYSRELLHAFFHGGGFMAYDMFATLGPASVLTVVSVIANAFFLLVGYLSHGFLATEAEMLSCWAAIVMTIVSTFLMFLGMGALAAFTEREHIHVAGMRKIVKACFAYPVFMLSYIPINVVALFRRVEWVPTRHTMAMTVDQVESGE